LATLPVALDWVAAAAMVALFEVAATIGLVLELDYEEEWR